MKQSSPNFKNSFVSLLSTGLDSPIATYLLMNKGFSCYAVSFLSEIDSSGKNEKKLYEVANKLLELTQNPIRIYCVNYKPTLELFKKRNSEKIRCLLCKRTMFRIAKEIVNEHGSKFIVTGEILGEQASQTLDNLYAINQITDDVPIIRPLIGYNKLDVIQLSQKLGFYDISLMEENSCTYNPKYPETRARLKSIQLEEKKLDFEAIKEKIVKNMTYKDFLP